MDGVSVVALLGGLGAYEEKGPWDVVMLEMELVNEENEDAGDDDGGDELTDSDDVEGEWWVGGRFLGDLVSTVAQNWTHF